MGIASSKDDTTILAQYGLASLSYKPKALRIFTTQWFQSLEGFYSFRSTVVGFSNIDFCSCPQLYPVQMNCGFTNFRWRMCFLFLFYFCYHEALWTSLNLVKQLIFLPSIEYTDIRRSKRHLKEFFFFFFFWFVCLFPNLTLSSKCWEDLKIHSSVEKGLEWGSTALQMHFLVTRPFYVYKLSHLKNLKGITFHIVQFQFF